MVVGVLPEAAQEIFPNEKAGNNEARDWSVLRFDLSTPSPDLEPLIFVPGRGQRTRCRLVMLLPKVVSIELVSCTVRLLERQTRDSCFTEQPGCHQGSFVVEPGLVESKLQIPAIFFFHQFKSGLCPWI